MQLLVVLFSFNFMLQHLICCCYIFCVSCSKSRKNSDDNNCIFYFYVLKIWQ
jgi:hypothetical protein